MIWKNIAVLVLCTAVSPAWANGCALPGPVKKAKTVKRVHTCPRTPIDYVLGGYVRSSASSGNADRVGTSVSAIGSVWHGSGLQYGAEMLVGKESGIFLGGSRKSGDTRYMLSLGGVRYKTTSPYGDFTKTNPALMLGASQRIGKGVSVSARLMRTQANKGGHQTYESCTSYKCEEWCDTRIARKHIEDRRTVFLLGGEYTF